MARFSVKERDGAAEGESSRRGRKRTKVVPDTEVVMEEGGDEVGDGNDEVENGEAAVIEEQADDSYADAGTKEGSISVILTDTDVLDCSICYEPLKIPVFQCKNGHIACASCCTKIKNKCPSCAFPIGYNRCRAIEKVIESLKVLCRNSGYGCRKRLNLSERKDHEEKCIHKPCHCPVCGFLGSSQQVWQHCSDTYSEIVKRFQYNHPLPLLPSDVRGKYMILLEEKEDAVFILKFRSEWRGYLIRVEYVCSVVPEKVLSYDIIARQDNNTLTLQSAAMEKHTFDIFFNLSNFFLLPPAYFDSNGQMKVELCIRLSN